MFKKMFVKGVKKSTDIKILFISIHFLPNDNIKKNLCYIMKYYILGNKKNYVNASKPIAGAVKIIRKIIKMLKEKQQDYFIREELSIVDENDKVSNYMFRVTSDESKNIFYGYDYTIELYKLMAKK